MDGPVPWRRLAGLAALLAVVIGTAIALSIRHTIRSSVRAVPPVARSVGAPTVLMTPRPADGLPEPAPASAPAPSTDAKRPIRAVPATSAEDEDLADAREAILRAAPEALVKGRAVHWTTDRMGGYVVPSEERDSGDRICRNIYATTDAGADRQFGRAQRWCRPADSNGWAPE